MYVGEYTRRRNRSHTREEKIGIWSSLPSSQTPPLSPTATPAQGLQSEVIIAIAAILVAAIIAIIALVLKKRRVSAERTRARYKNKILVAK